MSIKLVHSAAIITMLFISIPIKSVLAEKKFPDGILTSLALKIGERLYHSQKQGCASCHKVDGTGGAKAGAANLKVPTNWKSSQIANKVNSLGVEKETTRSIAVGLILNGAEKWNAEFYNQPEYSKIENKIFFDKRMIGVHSTALKMNQRMAKRILRKNKKRIASKNLLRLMAESVYVYINDNFFPEGENYSYPEGEKNTYPKGE